MAQEFAKQFYNSKLWKEVREYIIKRDRYRCVKCGAPAEEVHHIIKLTKDNINNPRITVNEKNLQSLCYECHKKEHTSNIVELRYRFDSEGNVLPIGNDLQ